MRGFRLLFCIAICTATGCASLKKDNEPKDPPSSPKGDEARATLAVYRPLIAAHADAHGLAVMGGSIGDSALFSCLGYVAGALTFDPAILFTADGKPIRHPDIAPNADGKGTPISRDMVDGILWCLHSLVRTDLPHAQDLLGRMIAFGKGHVETFGTEVGWLFCTAEDRAAYHIDDADWLGKCWMTPGVVKDVYRIAKEAGLACDADCQRYMVIGPNVPSNETGFRRHLAVIGTVRNGLVDGAINDNSLKIVLQKAAEQEPRNGLYQGAWHLFGDGDQAAALAALGDTTLFPAAALPTKANYCTEYLFQRDPDGGNPDWLPCPQGDDAPDNGRGIDFAFAAALVLGEVK